jgi:hypothetical protein
MRLQSAYQPDRKAFMRAQLDELIEKAESDDEMSKFGSFWLQLTAAGAALVWVVLAILVK